MKLELTFRLAKPSDFDEVLKLSEGIYDGHDYLPFTFHTWMKMENVAVMLAYSGEKLVGLLVCFIVDEGKTAIRRAARILPEFRGQGVYRQLLQAINDFIRRQYPSVCQERFKTLDSYPSVTKLAQFDILRYYVKRTSRSHRSSTNDSSIQIEACTREYLCDVIFSKPVAQKLFPDNIIAPDLIPIEPLPLNIDYLQQENALYFAVEKCSNGAYPRSVSFGVLSPRIKMAHWCVNVYTSDPILYEAHLVHQFKRACEVIDDNFIFRSFQEESLTAYGKRVLHGLIQPELDEEMFKMSVKLYENKLLST